MKQDIPKNKDNNKLKLTVEADLKAYEEKIEFLKSEHRELKKKIDEEKIKAKRRSTYWWIAIIGALLLTFVFWILNYCFKQDWMLIVALLEAVIAGIGVFLNSNSNDLRNVTMDELSDYDSTDEEYIEHSFKSSYIQLNESIRDHTLLSVNFIPVDLSRGYYDITFGIEDAERFVKYFKFHNQKTVKSTDEDYKGNIYLTVNANELKVVYYYKDSIPRTLFGDFQICEEALISKTTF